MMINTLHDLESLRPGALMIDAAGIPLVKTSDGQYAQWHQGDWHLFDLDDVDDQCTEVGELLPAVLVL